MHLPVYFRKKHKQFTPKQNPESRTQNKKTINKHKLTFSFAQTFEKEWKSKRTTQNDHGGHAPAFYCFNNSCYRHQGFADWFLTRYQNNWRSAKQMLQFIVWYQATFCCVECYNDGICFFYAWCSVLLVLLDVIEANMAYWIPLKKNVF